MLKRAAKIFIPLTVVGMGILFVAYIKSEQQITAIVMGKKVEQIKTCVEYNCTETPEYRLETADEIFVTSNQTYRSIVVGQRYALVVKGWNRGMARRRVVSTKVID
jgi:hypothetical protein